MTLIKCFRLKMTMSIVKYTHIYKEEDKDIEQKYVQSLSSIFFVIFLKRKREKKEYKSDMENTYVRICV